MTRLAPLPPEAFPAFFDAVVESYAHDNVACGRWRDDEALNLSRAEATTLLPRGTDTPGHRLFAIEDEREAQIVGFLWLATFARGSSSVAYLYQLIVKPPYRRRGHARAALQQAAAIAAAEGHRKLELHVFAHNAVAHALYRSLGFEVTGMNMALPLARGDAGAG